MIANPRFHRWRHAQCLVNAAEVIVHIVERDCVLQILRFFRECVPQPRKAAHRHAHREILSPNVTDRNVSVIGVAADYSFASAHADYRTVSGILRNPGQAAGRLPFIGLFLNVHKIRVDSDNKR
jgi:hypothetical protein